MDSFTNTTKSDAMASAAAPALPALAVATAGRVSLRPWFYGFASYLLLLALVAQWTLQANAASELAGRAWAITIFTIYLSLCCTFFPLPTSPLIVLLSGHVVNLAPGSLWMTMLAVSTAGAIGSTMANLNDYHIILWLLRYRRLAKVREMRLYKLAVHWFERAPFALLVIFNVLPIPVDVVRILAATNGYPRATFAFANFIGRFIRYAVLASLTFVFHWGNLAILVMLAIAAALAVLRFLWGQISRLTRRFTANAAAEQVV